MFITHRPRLIAYVAYAAVSLISRLAAQSSPAPPNQLPPLSQILDQHMRAIGGERAVGADGPLLLKGTCDSTGVDENGPIEILVKSPNAVYDLNHGGLRMGYDGESVWRAGSAEPLRQRKGRQLAELVTVFDPARARWWNEWYPRMAVTGVRQIDSREAFVLETLPGSPSTERLFIDRASGLLIRDEVTPQRTAPGAGPGANQCPDFPPRRDALCAELVEKYIFTFSDYRAVRGVMTAFAIQETTPNGIKYDYRFNSIEPIAGIDESRFRPGQ